MARDRRVGAVALGLRGKSEHDQAGEQAAEPDDQRAAARAAAMPR